MGRAFQLLGILLIVIGSLTIAGADQASGGRPGGGPPLPNQPPQRPTGTGAISGVVRDGQTGQPIAGALVYVGITGRGPANNMSRQITDAKGRFVFTDLPESDSFFLNVTKAGYNDGHYGDTGPISGGVGSGLVKLGRGEWFRDANIPMYKPAAIGGTVVDEAGEPVVGAFVRVLAKIYVAGSPQLAAGATVKTDDRGRFRIPGLASGTYLLNVPSVQNAVPRGTSGDLIEGIGPSTAARGADSARRNNGVLELDAKSLLIIGNYATPPAADRPQAYPPVFAPGVTALSAAAEITLETGEVRDNLAIVLRPVPAVRVTGRVDGPDDVRRGLVLRLVPVGLEGLGEGSEAATTIADAGGEFTFVNVPAGRYTLLAQRTQLEYSQRTSFGGSQELPRTPGLVAGGSTGISGIASGPPRTQVLTSSAAGDRSYFASLPVGVGDSDVTGINVPLRKGGGLRGRVLFEGTNVPPGSLGVVAEPADGNPALGLHQSAGRIQAGANDEFVFAGLPPGRFMIRLLGLTPLYAVQSIRAGSLDLMDRPIEAAPGGDLGDVVITVTDRVAVIEGTVQTDAAAGLHSVIAFPADRQLWSAYGMSAPRFKTAPVKNDNSFRIPNIPAGDYLLVAVPATHSRRWHDPAFLDVAARVASRVTADWGKAASVTLKGVVIK